jgi:Mg-chelatase subunit ChlD
MAKMMAEINALDLAFVVDTTGSMGALIAAAQRQMIAMLDALAQAADAALRLAVVEYRDHPPQDPLPSRVHAFTADRKQARKVIEGLVATGGGDGPESVLDGVLAACRELAWGKHARRIAVLVGDSPPHGVGARGDGFPRGCPCGETIESVSAAAEAVQMR